MTPETQVYDLPFVINGWSPRNEGGSYKGAMTLRQGLAQSVNTVAVRLHVDLGARRTVKTAARLGIKSDLRDGPALALGTSEVTLLELTGAYGAFANGGAIVEPHVIRRVATSGGRVIYQRHVTPRQPVVALGHVGAMNDMLNATLVSGTARRAGLARHPAAGKTGTSQDFRDAWFVGYTGHFIGGVWLGNDNGKAMNRIMGGTLPARLWRDVMAFAHEGKPTLPLAGTSVETPKTRTAPPIARAEPTDPIAALLAGEGAVEPKRPAERIDETFIERALRDDAYRPTREASREPMPVAREQVPAPAPRRDALPQDTGQSGYFRDALARLERERRAEEAERADPRSPAAPHRALSVGRVRP
jgi:penicillin-binding protein 1A